MEKWVNAAEIICIRIEKASLGFRARWFVNMTVRPTLTFSWLAGWTGDAGDGLGDKHAARLASDIMTGNGGNWNSISGCSTVSDNKELWDN